MRHLAKTTQARGRIFLYRRTVRRLGISSANFSIEVEITKDAFLGQLVPPHSGTAATQARTGQLITASIDDVGCFVIEPKPECPFRLHVRTEGHADVVTGWLTI